MYPDTAAKYATFAQAVAKHYKGTITLYEIGNEPNLQVFWPPSPNAQAYTQMLIEGFNAIKGVDPSAKVISAGLAGYQTSYVQSMYQYGAKGHFDYFGMHPYSWPKGPDEFNNSQYSFSALSNLKKIMESNGDSKQIMATEIGWPTFSGGVSETTQAAYIQRVYEKIMKEDYKYVPIACIYDFKNDGTNPNDAESNFGVTHNDFTKKPSFTTFKTMRQYFDANYTPILP
jgi:arabinogalactan endo-1,4-beta-galactosidase